MDQEENECDCDQCLRVVNDKLAKKIEALWKEAFPDAMLLPVIGYPSNNHGVLTLTHTASDMLMKINGLPSKSPLTNNALYSAEVSKHKYINLYEIMIPDIPGKNGCVSTAQLYIDTLRDKGLHVSATHYHWTGVSMFDCHVKHPEHLIVAVHHFAHEFNPYEFSKKTIKALKITMKAIDERVNC